MRAELHVPSLRGNSADEGIGDSVRGEVSTPAMSGPDRPGKRWLVRPHRQVGAPTDPLRPTRVLVAESEPSVRAGLTLRLGAEPDLCVVGQAADAAHAAELTHALAPDVVAMDLRLLGVRHVGATPVTSIADDRAGAGATGRVGGRVVNPDRGPGGVRAGAAVPAVLVLSTVSDDAALRACVRAGAAGFLLTSAAPRRLPEAIRVVAHGGTWVDPTVAGNVLHQFLGRDGERRPEPVTLHGLTGREREVLALVAHGLTNQQIAAHLIISGATVRNHLGRVMTKLQVHDRAQAVVVAYRSGLVRPDDPPPAAWANVRHVAGQHGA